MVHGVVPSGNFRSKVSSMVSKLGAVPRAELCRVQVRDGVLASPPGRAQCRVLGGWGRGEELAAMYAAEMGRAVSEPFLVVMWGSSPYSGSWHQQQTDGAARPTLASLVACRPLLNTTTVYTAVPCSHQMAPPRRRHRDPVDSIRVSCHFAASQPHTTGLPRVRCHCAGRHVQQRLLAVPVRSIQQLAARACSRATIVAGPLPCTRVLGIEATGPLTGP